MLCFQIIFYKEPDDLGEKWLVKRFLIDNCKKNISKVINEAIEKLLSIEMLLGNNIEKEKMLKTI